MPRRTPVEEVKNDEQETPASPLRRSSRILTRRTSGELLASTPKEVKTRRLSATSDTTNVNDEQAEIKKKGRDSIKTKPGTPKDETIKRKRRASSLPTDDSVKKSFTCEYNTDEEATKPRTRRNSLSKISEEMENKSDEKLSDNSDISDVKKNLELSVIEENGGVDDNDINKSDSDKQEDVFAPKLTDTSIDNLTCEPMEIDEGGMVDDNIKNKNNKDEMIENKSESVEIESNDNDIVCKFEDFLTSSTQEKSEDNISKESLNSDKNVNNDKEMNTSDGIGIKLHNVQEDDVKMIEIDEEFELKIEYDEKELEENIKKPFAQIFEIRDPEIIEDMSKGTLDKIETETINNDNKTPSDKDDVELKNTMVSINVETVETVEDEETTTPTNDNTSKLEILNMKTPKIKRTSMNLFTSGAIKTDEENQEIEVMKKSESIDDDINEPNKEESQNKSISMDEENIKEKKRNSIESENVRVTRSSLKKVMENVSNELNVSNEIIKDNFEEKSSNNEDVSKELIVSLVRDKELEKSLNKSKQDENKNDDAGVDDDNNNENINESDDTKENPTIMNNKESNIKIIEVVTIHPSSDNSDNVKVSYSSNTTENINSTDTNKIQVNIDEDETITTEEINEQNTTEMNKSDSKVEEIKKDNTTVIENSPNEKSDNENNDNDDVFLNNDDNEIMVLKHENKSLRGTIEKQIQELVTKCVSSGSEDFEEEIEETDSFVCEMADEVDDVSSVSEDSNEIIDSGETINTTDSDFSADDINENDSFVTDDEEQYLLSGNEYDLEMDDQRKSRLIKLDSDSDENLTEIENAIKNNIPEKKSRIIKPQDSNDDVINIIDNTLIRKKNDEKKENISQNKEINTSKNEDPSTSTTSIIQTPNRENNISLKKNSSVKKTNLIMQARVDNIQNKVSESIEKVLNSFCEGFEDSKEVSINVSLACQEIPEVNAESINEKPEEQPTTEFAISIKNDEIKKKKSKKEKNNTNTNKEVKVEENITTPKKIKKKPSDEISSVIKIESDKKMKKSKLDNQKKTTVAESSKDYNNKTEKSKKKKRKLQQTNKDLIMKNNEFKENIKNTDKNSSSSKMKNKSNKNEEKSFITPENNVSLKRKGQVDENTQIIKKKKPTPNDSISILKKQMLNILNAKPKKEKIKKNVDTFPSTEQDYSEWVVEDFNKKKQKKKKSSSMDAKNVPEWVVEEFKLTNTLNPSKGNQKAPKIKGQITASKSENDTKFNPKDFKNRMLYDSTRIKRCHLKLLKYKKKFQ